MVGDWVGDAGWCGGGEGCGEGWLWLAQMIGQYEGCFQMFLQVDN
ncbi:MAG: hypothetical protein ACYSSL_10730 [Planctomycetota bacterium]